MKNSWYFLFCLIVIILAPNFTNAYPLPNYEVTFLIPAIFFFLVISISPIQRIGQKYIKNVGAGEQLTKP